MSEPIQSSWKQSHISEYFELLIGGTPSRSNNAYWDNEKLTGNKWVSIKDIKERYIFDTEEQITDLGVEKSNVKIIPENTVIMSFKLTIGRLTITKCPLYTNEAIVSFISKKSNSVDTNYLYYGLQSWNLLDEVDQAVKGATLNKDKMSRIFGLFPPLLEQKKIASILTSVDEVIETTQKQIDKLQDLKKAIMNNLLTKGIGHREFKDSELGRIPKSWEVKTLGELSYIIDPHPSHRAPPEINDGVPFLGIGDLDINGDITSSKLRLVSRDEIPEHRKRYKITSNSIGFGRVASIGKIIDFHKEQEDILLSPTLAVIEQYGINKKFLVNFLKSLKIQDQLNNFITGSTRLSLGIQLLRELYILIPPLPEQQKIGQILTSIDSKKESADRKLSQTQSLKKSLMQDLLTGKVRVKVN